MNKVLLLIALTAFGFANAQHKFLDFPKLSEVDLRSDKSEKYPDAHAEILYRSTHFNIDFKGNMYQKVVNRVKIYNREKAADYLDHEIILYDDKKGSVETLTDLKAYTYNYENGVIVTTKVSRDEKYRSKEDRNYNVTKFAFPNVKNGSVVEYSYQIMTPFLNSTPKIMIEREIPVRYSEFIMDYPTVLSYNINYKGNLAPSHRVVEEKRM